MQAIYDTALTVSIEPRRPMTGSRIGLSILLRFDYNQAWCLAALILSEGTLCQLITNT